MIRKVLFTGIGLILALAMVLPTAAQSEETHMLSIGLDDLQAAFADYAAIGFSLDHNLAIAGATVSLDDDVIVLDVFLGMTAESAVLEGVPNPTVSQWEFINAWPLTVVLVPTVDDDGLSWGLASADLSDGAGHPVELPQLRLRALLQTTREAWRSAFVDSVRTAREKGTAFSDPGRPLIINLSVGFDTIDIEFTLEPLRAAAGTRAGGGVEARRVEISKDQFNQAFAAIAANRDRIESLSFVMADGSVHFLLTTNALCTNEVIEGVFQFNAAASSGGYEGTVATGGLLTPVSLTCGGEPLEPSESRMTNFEVQDLMSRVFARVIDHAAGGNAIIAVELDAGNKIIAVLIG